LSSEMSRFFAAQFNLVCQNWFSRRKTAFLRSDSALKTRFHGGSSRRYSMRTSVLYAILSAATTWVKNTATRRSHPKVLPVASLVSTTPCRRGVTCGGITEMGHCFFPKDSIYPIRCAHWSTIDRRRSSMRYVHLQKPLREAYDEEHLRALHIPRWSKADSLRVCVATRQPSSSSKSRLDGEGAVQGAVAKRHFR
jgi:hypothetical protein